MMQGSFGTRSSKPRSLDTPSSRISLLLGSPCASAASRASALITSRTLCRLSSREVRSAILPRSSSLSLLTLDTSMPVSLRRGRPSTDLACSGLRPNLAHSASSAAAASADSLISATASSTLVAVSSSPSENTLRYPSTMWCLLVAISRSCLALFSTVSTLKDRNSLNTCFRLRLSGCLSTRATMLQLNLCCSLVLMYRLFSTRSGSWPLCTSMTMRIPSLSLSSLMSVMPWILPASTISAICSIRLDLLTW
mmetsp:Transcript_6739/g.20278  ORF Transcript_6739/g.20278 Transcript_6739/m.20278 type:complete len:252 (-) Transcript_6739:1205-1960(-)